MDDYRFVVRLTLHAPVLSQTIGTRGFGIDSPALRDPYKNPALPGSLIRGNLRHAWEAFEKLPCPPVGIPNESDRKEWLGDKSKSGTYDPCRGRLRFSEHWVAKQQGGERVRHRVARDRTKGAVKPGALQMIEDPFGAGREVVYEGDIEASLESPQVADRLARWICKGLEYVPALGAFKGVGFGRVLKVEVNRMAVPKTLKVPMVDVDPMGFGIRLKLDRPFCSARPHALNNRFESEDFIPGAAIKGAMARQLNPWPTLRQHFDALRISHALPVPEAQANRPVVSPLSLVIAPESGDPKAKDKLYDMALRLGAGLIHKRAPAFAPDWKGEHWGIANQRCGWSSPERVLRVHTAIDPNTGTAKENDLFSVESVDPKGYQWLADVDLSHIEEKAREQVIKELVGCFSQDLIGLGKIKACAKVESLKQRHTAVIPSSSQLREGLAIVVLQSAARLLPGIQNVLPTNGGEALLQAYQRAWNELSGGSLKLERFFARQTLVGGTYLWIRFRKQADPYNPEVLTLPGSVFVLEACEKKRAEQKLEEWLRQGLPQLANAPGGEDWQQTPYIAANGYGEIAVNLDLHWDPNLDPKGAWYGLG